MSRTIRPHGKMVKGKCYAEEDEEYDKKIDKKVMNKMKMPGIATALKKAEKETPYSHKPRVIPQKKGK